MRVPAEVMVGGRKLRVEYVDSLEGGYGDLKMSDGLIRIAMDQHDTEEEVFSTLFHELTHYALWLTGHSEAWSDPIEEAVVTALENMLAGLFVFSKVAPVKWKDRVA